MNNYFFDYWFDKNNFFYICRGNKKNFMPKEELTKWYKRFNNESWLNYSPDPMDSKISRFILDYTKLPVKNKPAFLWDRLQDLSMNLAEVINK